MSTVGSTHPLCKESAMSYFPKVVLPLRVLARPRGNCAPTIESEKNPMEPRCGPIFVMWLEGPATFVPAHPSARVGWADPSQETPDCSCLRLCCIHLTILQSSTFFFFWKRKFLLSSLFWFNLAPPPPRLPPHWLPQLTCNCVNCLFLDLSSIFLQYCSSKPHTAPFPHG